MTQDGWGPAGGGRQPGSRPGPGDPVSPHPWDTPTSRPPTQLMSGAGTAAPGGSGDPTRLRPPPRTAAPSGRDAPDTDATATRRHRARPGRLAIGAGTLTLALLAGLGTGWGIRATRPHPVPVIAAASPSASPTPDPVAICRAPTQPVASKDDPALITGSGLGYPHPPGGWSNVGLAYHWIAQEHTIGMPTPGKKWRSFMLLGTIYVDSPASVRFGATQSINCYAGEQKTPQRPQITVDQPLTVSGRPAWRQAATIRLEPAQDGVDAILADIVVVDLGVPNEYSVFFTAFVAGHEQAIRDADAARARLVVSQ